MPIDTTTPGGISGSHPVLEGGAAKVGPSTGSEKNTVATLLIPLGCWRVEDMRFQFDSSFVLPGIMTEIPLLKKLREDHTLRVPGGAAGAEKLIPPPVSLFGHADPVGSDVYNKELSGRRAMAIYGLLTRDIAMWEKLFSHAHSQGGDQWGDASLITMLEVTDPTTATDEAHRDSELADHRGSAGKRATLFQNYMDKITAGFKLEKSDFLGQGADSKGKADYQGCGEFNPVKLFSEEDEKEFQKPENKEVRNVGNGPNRRVMALLFRPGTEVDPKKWPCPRAEEPGAGCIKRFWSDGEKRRSKHLPGEERLFEETHDTFGCRFYHRLAASSPCEKVLPRLTSTLEVVADSNDDTTVDASEAATDFVRVGLWDHAFEAATGNLINTSDDKKNFIGQDSKGKEARRFYFRVTDPNAKGQAQVRVNWRTEFGAGGDDDAPASQVISLLATSDPAVFVSKAVFLVADKVDQAQTTDSGLGAANAEAGQRKKGEANHRIRKITVDDTHKLDTNLVAEYSSVMGGGTSKVVVPLFKRSPDERLKINIHLVNVRKTAGGDPVLSATRKADAIEALHNVYACTGIFLNIDEMVIDPPASCIGWSTRFPNASEAVGADPSVEKTLFSGGNLSPSPSMSDIITLVRADAKFDANDIYIVYVNKIWARPLPPATGQLAIGPGGTSFPDSFTAAGEKARSFVFVGLQTVNVMADPHEVTHVTTNLRNDAGGHFHLAATVDAGPGNIDGRNLMQRHALIFNSDPKDSKRLWDEDFTNANLSPSTIPAQITAIRKSRFARPL